MIISQEGKKVSLNGKELNKLSEMSGNVYIVTFAPTDVNFYKGSTVDRRKFIDVSSKLNFLFMIDTRLLNQSFQKKLLLFGLMIY